MEEQNAAKEVSDSNSSSLLNSKKRRRGNPAIDTSSTTGKRFKGVVVQRNGHWGAQIYAHDRIWLGTFKSQVEAAMAYDSAAMKIRSGDAHRNFRWTRITAEELKFQSQFSSEAVLRMIKDGSYPIKLADYLRKESKPEAGPGISTATPVVNSGLVSKKLFHKRLTPSDVGKLNRLVVPKKYALMHFPLFSKTILEKGQNGESYDTELEFLDSSMQSWKFHYCYWRSSHSFVFTRGWNRFVRDKGLKAKDTVIFSFCEFKDGSGEKQSAFVIDAGYYDHLQSNSGQKSVETNNGDVLHEQVKSNNVCKIGKQELRLFGVQIVLTNEE